MKQFKHIGQCLLRNRVKQNVTMKQVLFFINPDGFSQTFFSAMPSSCIILKFGAPGD